MPNHIPPFAVPPGRGKRMETPTGGSATIKADTMNTSGSFTVLEIVNTPKDRAGAADSPFQLQGG